MPDARLGELDMSRLLDDFKALPRHERLRISRANRRGVALTTEPERNLQRALLRQLPGWITVLLAITMPLQALDAWTHYADDHSALQLIGALVCTVVTPGAWWYWWAGRLLRRRLDAATETS